MSDDDIRMLRRQYMPHAPVNADCCEACDIATLADEALARGANFELLQTATIAEEKRLRERVAQLEIELRWMM